MPQLADVLQKKRNKKFVKKSYRPWDLSGTTDEIEQTTESTSEQLAQPTQNTDTRTEGSTTEATSSLSQSNDLDNAVIASDAIELDNNKITIRQQLDNNKLTLREQKDSNQATNKLTNRQQLDNNIDNSEVSNLLTKPVANLVGLQQKILEFIVDYCEARGSLETGPIPTMQIVAQVGSTYGSIKMSLNRLICKGFLIRQKGKLAKGGYINLTIPPEVKKDLSDLKRAAIQGVVLNRSTWVRNHYSDNKLDNNSLYSSSNINNTITTHNPLLSNEWKQIDLEPLQHIGFSENHLKQLINRNTPEIVQESINHFAYALDYNEKYKNHANPLNLIMGVLRKGQGWFETNYRSPQEIAQEKFLEQKKLQLERQQKLAEEAFDIAYQEWLEKNNDSAKKKFISDVPEEYKNAPEQVQLRMYFKTYVWPELKNHFLK